MALFLVRHGRALSAEVDPERGLTEEGMSEVRQVAEVAAARQVRVSCIKHSGKKRARQTAEILGSALKPERGVEEMKGLRPSDDVAPVAERVDSEEDLMLVGHLPFMERLCSYLVTGSTDRPVCAFRNGGIVCLEEEPEVCSWVIKWAILPDKAGG